MAHDVVVLGATIAGLTVARRLAHKGYDVLVLDPNAESDSAAVGHGIAAVGHASTIAAMANSYGLDEAREHIRRNLSGFHEIRRIHPDHRTLPFVDASLPGGDEGESRAIVELYRGEGIEADLLVAPDGVSIRTEALAVDVTAYADTLRAAAVAAGANVVHGVTVAHLTRREGMTRVHFRNNLAWVRDLGMVEGRAVIDTMGISPWGAAAKVGATLWVPVVRCTPSQVLTTASLRATSSAWMLRPVGTRALVLGHKVNGSRITQATAELHDWCVTHLGATHIEEGRLAIDASDHGRPVVGASAIPGGFYARGNGRGELMNGTASGWYLAELLSGSSPNSLPPLRQLRAYSSRLWKR